MITVIVSKGKTGDYKRIEVCGHAMFSEYGKDIVCAAVSVLTLNTLNSIEVFCGDAFDAEEDEKTGRLVARFHDKLGGDATLLLNSLLLGLDGIKEEYGEKYITILRQEV